MWYDNGASVVNIIHNPPAAMDDIQIIDTTLRDGQLSLWALGMKTGAMLAIAEQMDQCGFQSMEFFGFAGYIKFVHEHKENP